MSETPYNRMMHEMCVDMGFCGGLRGGKPSHVDDFVPSEGTVKADQFLSWLFIAEGDGYPHGYDPKTDQLYAELRSIFIKHMGSERVDASLLKWDV